ncbi:hypothetical protein C8Q72DRAFT_116995 [Fomitopsis betulina]|nr:hypothetical protein C8Q72DRAFT_116995 [Fomitopsis betulina]
MPSADEPPQRCESRLSQRPPLRRTHASFRLPKLPGFDDDLEDEFDDDSDPEFSAANFSIRAAPPGLCDYDDDDDDDDLGELIRFRLDDRDHNDFSAPPSFPPASLLLPRPSPPPCDDFFSLDTPPAYHGFSYHALALVKRVWNSRRAHWARHPSPDPSTAYDGIAMYEPDYPIPDDYATPAVATPPPESRLAAADPDVPIFPRLGDLCSLRDTRAATVDRAFCNFPLYTIRKVLYLHDMLRPGPQRCAAAGVQVVTVSVDERAVNVLCDQFERAMVLDAPLPVCAKGWSPASFARWRILLEKATGRQVSAADVVYDDEKARCERAPPRPKTPHFFLIGDEDDEDDESPLLRRSTSPSDESDDDGWDEVSLESSPGQRAVTAPVFYLDRRTLPVPMHVGHASAGIMAY